MNCTCCIKLFWAEGYTSVSRHNQLLFDYCRSESWVNGIYYIYEEILTATFMYTYMYIGKAWTIISLLTIMLGWEYNILCGWHSILRFSYFLFKKCTGLHWAKSTTLRPQRTSAHHFNLQDILSFNALSWETCDWLNTFVR